MSMINILSPHVADLIAAGEVVERPASVVKELVENSIDAGASSITIELSHGGLTFIRVSDNGSGMSPEDAGVCFLRHATSKLHDEHGLEAIGTLGFRGEALAAISAVSRIELTTRAKDAQIGAEMTVEAGDIITMRELALPPGTVMTVRDLFFNTPARLKFMKSDRAESAQCISVALKCALAHPEVSIRLIRDGKEVFFTPGDGLLASAAYALLGREEATQMLACDSEAEGISVTGLVSSPRGGRGNRAQQFFFVNGRAIRSLQLQTALEKAYKNTLLTGKYPSCILHIGVSCETVDVNVHPTKAEVKFSDERKVFSAVYLAVLSALQRESAVPEIELSTGTRGMVSRTEGEAPLAEKRVEPRRESGFSSQKSSGEAVLKDGELPDNCRIMSADEYKERFLGGGVVESGAPYKTKPAQPRFFRDSASADRLYKDGAIAAYSGLFKGTAPISEPKTASEFEKTPSVPVEKPAEPAALARDEAGGFRESILPAAPSYSVVGEALNTYILVQTGNSLVFIDKHAAHERSIFDSLKKNEISLMSQGLLEPIVFKPGYEKAQTLLNNRERLLSLGFELEEFGEDDLIVRAIPDIIDRAEAVSTLDELAEQPELGIADSILHTIACKAAIKAGRDSLAIEREAIAEKVMSGAVKYCPHGRPVSFALTKKELDKLFMRIV